MFALGDFWLKTRIIINFWPILDNQVALTDFHGDEAKKIQNGRLKKTELFKITNSQNIFVKISWIGPWVSRIDWCEGHWCSSTYMVVRLSNISSKILLTQGPIHKIFTIFFLEMAILKSFFFLSRPFWFFFQKKNI